MSTFTFFRLVICATFLVCIGLVFTTTPAYAAGCYKSCDESGCICPMCYGECWEDAHSDQHDDCEGQGPGWEVTSWHAPGFDCGEEGAPMACAYGEYTCSLIEV